MIIRRIGVLSFVKVCIVIYAAMGLLIGGCLSILSVLGSLQSGLGKGLHTPLSLVFGLGAVVVLPLLYGALGGIAAGVGAAVYNVVAARVGGVSIDLVVGTPEGKTGIGPGNPV